MDPKSLSQFASELSAHIRARYSLIALHTGEEERALQAIESVCQARGSAVYVWSRTQGVVKGTSATPDMVDPLGVLKWFETVPEKSVLVLKDFHPYLKEPSVVRKLRDLGQAFKRLPKNILFISPCFTVPVEMQKEIAVLDMPLPTREEIRPLIDRAAASLGEKAPAEPERELLAEASGGLTLEEVENVLAKSLVSEGKLDPRLVLEEKKQIVRKSGLVEFIDTQGQKNSVGGMKLLRQWLAARRRGFSKEARALGLPSPKGMLLVGVPGCGKSLTAQAVSQE
ncbi:ATPase, partial [bacterium]|nr:ATPase [bacterium]